MTTDCVVLLLVRSVRPMPGLDHLRVDGRVLDGPDSDQDVLFFADYASIASFIDTGDVISVGARYSDDGVPPWPFHVIPLAIEARAGRGVPC